MKMLFPNFINKMFNKQQKDVNVFVVVSRSSEIDPRVHIYGIFKSLTGAKQEYERCMYNTGNAVEYEIVQYGLHE